MRLANDSWVITTEVTLLPLKGAIRSDAVRVQVLSFSVGAGLDPGGGHPLQHSDRSLALDGDYVALRHLSKGWMPSVRIDKTMADFVGRSLRFEKPQDRDYRWEEELATDILNQVVVPVFGSPPQDWQSLAALVSSGGGASVVTAVAAVDGSSAPVTFIVSFATMTVLINVVSPATTALGRGIAHRIDRFMGTPPEPPAAPSAAAPAPIPAD